MKKKLKYFLQSAAIVAGAGIVCASVISCTTNTNSNKTSNSNTNNNNNTSQFSPTSNSLNLYTNASNGIKKDNTLSYDSSIGGRSISISGNFIINSATKNDYFGLMIAKSGLTYDSVNQMYEDVVSLTNPDDFNNQLIESLSTLDMIYASGWSSLNFNFWSQSNDNVISTSLQQITKSGNVTFNLLKAIGTYQYSASTTYSLYLIGLNKNYSEQENPTYQDVLKSLPSLEIFQKISNFNINLAIKSSWGKFSLSETLPTLNVNNIYNTSLTIKGNLGLSNFNGSYYSFVLAATPSILDYTWSTTSFTENGSYLVNSNNFSKDINVLCNYNSTGLLPSLSFVHKLYLILVVANSIQNLNDGNFELYQNVGQILLSN